MIHVKQPFGEIFIHIATYKSLVGEMARVTQVTKFYLLLPGISIEILSSLFFGICGDILRLKAFCKYLHLYTSV